MIAAKKMCVTHATIYNFHWFNYSLEKKLPDLGKDISIMPHISHGVQVGVTIDQNLSAAFSLYPVVL